MMKNEFGVDVQMRVRSELLASLEVGKFELPGRILTLGSAHLKRYK